MRFASTWKDSLRGRGESDLEYDCLAGCFCAFRIRNNSITVRKGFFRRKGPRPSFPLWPGPPLADTYGHKPVLVFEEKPTFAELVILGTFKADGWDGVWVDCYRRKYRKEWPSDGEEMPEEREAVLKRIRDRVGGWGGCFDVFCWRSDQVCFIEAKRHGKDHIRPSQRRWLEAAIQCGVDSTAFLIVEWMPKETARNAVNDHNGLNG